VALKIKKDTDKYQKLLKSPEGKNLGGIMDEKQLRGLPGDAYILTGDKTKDFGGGPSPYGFVMSAGGKLLGRVKL
jgi:hypothetical protein